MKHAFNMLHYMQFPMLIGVSSKQACYDHVVVVWNNAVIDYELKYTYRLTEESLRQVCGEHTTFQKITCGYGIFPSKMVREDKSNSNVIDWGSKSFLKDKQVKAFFK